MLEAKLLEPQSTAWIGALGVLRHDFYHLPGYVALEAVRQGGVPRCLLVSSGGRPLLLAPLIVRPLPHTVAPTPSSTDATTPYGYPGPLWAAGLEPGNAVEVVRAAVRCLHGSGIVCAFVRLHPLLDCHVDSLDVAGEVVTHGQTVVVDLRMSEQEMWRQTRSSDKNRINKALRKGIRAHIDSDWERINDFVRIYRMTMDRLSAQQAYYFSYDYFNRLRSVLKSHGHGLHLCIVETASGEAVAAGLFSEVCQIVQFHLSGTVPAAMADSPSRVMLDFMTIGNSNAICKSRES